MSSEVDVPLELLGKKITQLIDDLHQLVAETYCGPSDVGYLWRNLFLPNGTTLRVWHRREEYSATVRQGELIFMGMPSSPAGMVHDILNGNATDAWQRVYVYRPRDTDWRVAGDVRKVDGTKDFRRIDRPRYRIKN